MLYRSLLIYSPMHLGSPSMPSLLGSVDAALRNLEQIRAESRVRSSESPRGAQGGEAKAMYSLQICGFFLV